MAESFLARARRVISAGVETAIDAAERASSESLMREAIREVERAADKLKAQSAAAEASRLQAAEQRRAIPEQLKTLDEQARFALAKGRDDLAKAAVARQIELEAEATRLASVQDAAVKEKQRLDAELATLGERKASMEQDYAAVATVKPATDAAPRRHGATQKVERAAAAFERAMTNTTGKDGTPTSAEIARKLAEIEAAQRETAAEERLAAMREGKGKAKKSERPKARR